MLPILANVAGHHLARGSAASAVMELLIPYLKKAEQSSSLGSSSSSGFKSNVIQLTVTDSIQPDVNGNFYSQSPSNIPKGFADVCDAMD
jgi:hypothetical protein